MTSVPMYMSNVANDRLAALGAAIEGSRTPHDLREILPLIARTYGVKNAVYLGVCVPKICREEPYVLVTYSDEWVQHYKNENYVVCDPVLLSASETMLPLDWRDLEVHTDKQKRLFEDARRFDVGNQGVTVPVRGRIGDYALFSLNDNATDDEWTEFLDVHLMELHIVGTLVHQAVLRAHGVEIVSLRLSKRETDVLRCYGNGLNKEQTAYHLGISIHTVRNYLEGARAKLRAVNTVHAVAIAQSRHIIPPPD